MRMERTTLSLLSILLLASALPVAAQPQVVDRYRQQWEQAVARQGLDPAMVVHPLAASEEMYQAALQAAGLREPREQLRQLQAWLFDPQQFPFDYEARETLTAREAFAARRGNCVSFTNLFIALGRSLGVPLQAALIQRGDSELEGDLVVINTHMVAVYQHSDGAVIYDFSRASNRTLTGMWVMDDVWVSAVYMNNKAVEAIRGERYDEAVEILDRVLRLTPDFTAAYGNLGVAHRLAGQPDLAFDVYHRALELEARDPTVLNNLASLLRSLGRTAEAQAALKAASLRGATPYLLVTRGDLEAREGNVREAKKLYRRAHKEDQTLPEPLLALARLYREQNQPDAARRYVRRALRLDPEHPEAVRLAERLGLDTN